MSTRNLCEEEMKSVGATQKSIVKVSGHPLVL